MSRGVVVARGPAGRRVLNSHQPASTIPQLCAAHGAIPYEPAVPVRLLNEEDDTIAGLQVGIEVNLTTEDPRERHRQLRRLAGGCHRGKQRWVAVVDHGRDNRGLLPHVVTDDRRVERVRLAHARGRAQEVLGVDFVFQKPDAAVVRPLEPPRLARPQSPEIEHARHGGHDAVDVGVVQVLRRQQARERRAGGDTSGNDLAVGGKHDVASPRGAARQRLCTAARTGGTGAEHDDESKQEQAHRIRTASVRAVRRKCQRRRSGGSQMQGPPTPTQDDTWAGLSSFAPAYN